MLSKPSDFAGSSYFDPKKYMTSLALLVEPKTIEKGVPSTYKGQTRMRDEVIADVAIFDNQAALESATPTEVIKSTKVVHGMLASTLEKTLGGAIAATITKVDTSSGAGYVFRDVDDDAEASVVQYLEARAAAAAAAPSFD